MESIPDKLDDKKQNTTDLGNLAKGEGYHITSSPLDEDVFLPRL